jgi:catechol 2,3-dioxygenase-like lactoylglutathione lyase family enzyme
MRPVLTGVLETALYVADMDRAVAFYERVFGFPKLVADGRICAFEVVGRQVLLLFKQGASVNRVTTAGGVLPGHDGSGTTHFAFAIPAAELQRWRDWLAECGVEIESELRWERGGTSLYFRDPDGHLVELATPGVWATY